MGNKQVVTTKLSDLCELIVDCPHSTPEWTGSGFIVLRNQNIRNGSLDLSSPSFTDENGYNSRIKRAVPQAGDIVLTREAPMGEVCLIPEGLKCCLGQRQVLLRPKRDVSGEYLFWALQSPFVRHQISWSEGTGTTVSNIRIPVLKAFEIPRWFESEPQIASHLSAIKNKITLNQKINQTLEQMAQTLFKSWFVDFDPVVDNALDAGFFEQDLAFPDELLCRAETRRKVREQRDFKPLPESTRQLFPAAFDECDEPCLGLRGWVPKGWMTAPLTTIANIVYGKNLPKSQINNEGYPVYGGNGVIGSYSKYLYKDPQVLISCRGAASGKVHWTKPFCFVTNNSLIIEERCVNSLYIYYCLLQQDLTNLTSGSAQPQMTIANLNPVNLLLPENELISTFVRHAQDLQTNCEAREFESETLSNLRDTLLPKLISGELRLDNIKAAQTKEEVA
ncbi:restriction endonuclease subunit S [Aeromonas salmonicida]|uniref:Type I restriction enzyme S subunit n=1 Tax=Aeromonas salmonicida TaxID=645 RepID=A0AAX1PGB0_AERSA|nr:restriction endonuclease subunit S [Aeromonas salmonicida]RAJ02724.1 type I restriction enzyme S subunit [Aeromonas salmonicida]